MLKRFQRYPVGGCEVAAGLVSCRRRETLLAIFEQDEGCKTSENGFAGIGTSPSPMLGADQRGLLAEIP
ncbi:Uncharacterized protein HZ326_25772 [Fusarium oxysporum f. sp. albedinis]|nr:Uncharacterized protein HZ326_25772 [Fusarium oxysporum f. sp. albedinis]